MSRSPYVSRLGLVAVVLAVCLLLPACGNSKVTKPNFDKITVGMTLSEVEAILGKGSKVDEGDGSNVAAQVGVDVTMGAGPPRKTGDTYTWDGKGDKSITVFFGLDGKVKLTKSKGL
jgi:hypothetical protein